jgi:hypothetical protein
MARKRARRNNISKMQRLQTAIEYSDYLNNGAKPLKMHNVKLIKKWI